MIHPNGSPIDQQQNQTYPLLFNFVEDIGYTLYSNTLSQVTLVMGNLAPK